MSAKRKSYSADFKAKLVLEVLKGEKTVNEIASHYEVLPASLKSWKKQFLENMSLAFDKSTVVKEYKDEIEELKKSKDSIAKKLGETIVEKEFLEGKLVSLASSKERKVLLDTKLDLSLNKQCKLLHIGKSSLYYQPKKPFSTGNELKLLDAINNIYSDFPSYGYRRIHSQLLRDTSILKEALALYPKPEIFNTDQGSQYTSKVHTDILKKHNIKISMDGVGRATDNICIERFWRSIKYEEIYLNEYKNMKVLNRAIEKYIDSYNRKRLHSTIDYKTPNEVYYEYINNLDFRGGKLLPSVS